MAPSSSEKMKVQCPGCKKQLMVPVNASGKAARCPGCNQTFTIPEVFQLEAIPSASPASQAFAPAPYTPPQSDPLFSDLSSFEQSAQPFPSGLPLSGAGFPAPADASERNANEILTKARAAQTAKSYDGDAFAMEKKGIDKGIIGGLIMMIIAVVWFVGGLFGGFIFFYPPILFLFGLFGFIKGLATGNFRGRK